MKSTLRIATLAAGLLAVAVIEAGTRSPSPSADASSAVPAVQHPALARGNGRGVEPGSTTLSPPRAPWAPVKRLTAVDTDTREHRSPAADGPMDMKAQRTSRREADRERQERRIRRCKYLAEIARVARRDVLVEIIYERNRLGCGGLGY